MTVNQLDRFVLLIGVWSCFSLFGIAYATCPTHWFSCGNSGVCIPRQHVCDYHSDCPNGEDEDQSCEPPWCDWHQFECSSNYTSKHDHCLQRWFICDGQADCSDGSDEKGCDYVACSESSFKCDSGQCIISDLKCDGKWNCRDKSDENNCDHTVCHPDEFRCLSDSKCISSTKHCDQHHDCDDGSDELDCYHPSVDNYLCQSNAYVCANGWCISPRRKCDGFDDCGDLSDENGCKLSCGEKQFSCADGSKCINEEYVCDGTPHCADASDETSQCSTGLCEMKQCEYTCVPSLRGGRCACPTGLYMADNNSLCEDMNECKSGGFCDQLCTNTPGSYSCSCVDGYHLDGSRCVAKNSSQMRLVYTDQRSIYRLDTSGEVSAELIIKTTKCSGVAYHYEKGLLLWTDMQSRKVFVGNLHDSSGTAVREISVKSTHWLPVALDVDWIRNNVYVLDQRGEKVDVFDLDGHYHYFMLAKLLVKPNDIALDPTIGLMFIADQRKILRANMDGSSLVTLVDVRLLSTTGITLDTVKKLVYFCDPERHLIEVVDYSGNNRKTVIRVNNNDPSPSRLTKFERNIYWTSTQRPGVYGVDEMKGTDSIVSVYQHRQRNADIENTLALKAIHPVLQPKSSDPCYKSSCEHFCFSTNSSEASGMGYRCACSVGFQLTGSHCQKVKNFIIFTLWNYIGSLLLRNDSKQRASDTDSEKTGNMADFSYGMEPVISPHRRIYGLDFDARKNKIYYIQSNEVCSVYLDGSSHHCYVMPMGNMSLLSLDWVTGNLYYISLFDDKLGVMNTENTVISRELLENLSNPVGLTVHPNKGLVFCAEWTDPPRITRMASDGSQLFVLSNLDLSWPNGIAIDYDLDRLYWTDARYDIIGHSNLDGSDVQLAVAAHVISHPFALVVDTGFIYVVDSTSGIFRFEKINNNANPVLLVEAKGNQKFSDVKLSSQKHQKIRSDHPCKDENGGCEHFCFAVNNENIVESDGPNFVGTLRAQCGCSDGFQLMADSRRCIDIVCDSGHRICPGSKQCLPEALFCNGINDCPDGSDENNCKTNSSSDNSSQKSCEVGEFRCRDGACIPSNWRCDFVSDCSDRSDEFCTYPRAPQACHEGGFRCNNSDCISIAYRCDNTYDCEDKSDESNCPQVICNESQFRCANGILCISESFQCDGEEDCQDGSDERNCTINVVTPSMDSTQFKCESKDQFIPITSYCDGVMDCNDNSDEHHGCIQDLCEPGFFQCDNKECIVEELVCDGNEDCEDGSDERNQQFCNK